MIDNFIIIVTIPALIIVYISWRMFRYLWGDNIKEKSK